MIFQHTGDDNHRHFGAGAFDDDILRADDIMPFHMPLSMQARHEVCLHIRHIRTRRWYFRYNGEATALLLKGKWRNKPFRRNRLPYTSSPLQ